MMNIAIAATVCIVDITVDIIVNSVVIIMNIHATTSAAIVQLHLLSLLILVFSECFRAGFYTFSLLKFKVNKGTNSCNFCFKIKTKTYLVFISMVTIHFAYHC